jgi:curved DNA-binding protein CbpA
MTTMGGVDYYARLGVTSDASAREIRRAYRRLARQHHPDLNPGPEESERFAELAHAYAILNDPAQRARYDQARRPPPQAMPLRTSRSPAAEHAFRRGILELSPSEALQLARGPLTLTDHRGRTIVLPAGAGHGDEVTLFYDGRPATLTIRISRKS